LETPKNPPCGTMLIGWIPLRFCLRFNFFVAKGEDYIVFVDNLLRMLINNSENYHPIPEICAFIFSNLNLSYEKTQLQCRALHFAARSF
jgi:hypothetical protein